MIALYAGWIAAQAPGGGDLHAAWFNLGTELGQAGDAAAAMQAYRTVLAINPGFLAAAINLGLLLERHGEPRAALQVWGDALQPDESRIALLNQRGRLLEQSGDLAGAADALHASLLTRHDQPDAVQHWLHLRQKMCQWPVLAETIPGLTRHDLIAQCGPLAALALTDDVPTQRAIAAGWIARKTQPKPALAPPDGYRHDRVRVGYLSSDFCSHAMSYLIAELFERHDRSRFEIHGYCASPDDGSPIRARVIAAFDHFTSVRLLSDEAAAQRIRDDEIDILIDLNGLTSGGRLQILRWKPAPVQATYLGFIGPVPLPELDFLLCDDFVIPPGIAAAYQPEPLAIEGLYQANDSKRVVGARVTQAAGWTAGRSFRVLLLLQSLQNFRRHVFRLDGDPAADRRFRAVADRRQPVVAAEPATAGTGGRDRSVSTVVRRPHRSGQLHGSVGGRRICSWTRFPTTPAPSPATRSAWGCRC